MEILVGNIENIFKNNGIKAKCIIKIASEDFEKILEENRKLIKERDELKQKLKLLGGQSNDK